MKWSIIIFCLVANGCTSEPEPFNAEELKQRLKPKRMDLVGSNTPIESTKEEISAMKAENLQLKDELKVLTEKIEDNARKIETTKSATKREIRDCPPSWK